MIRDDKNIFLTVNTKNEFVKFQKYLSNNYVGENMYYLNGGGGILCGFSFGEDPLSINMYSYIKIKYDF